MAGMMTRNLFSEIFKYRQSKTQSPLENYCTEIFVFILRRLIETKDNNAYEILKLFGFSKIEKEGLEGIEIVTQKSCYVKDQPVRPDIIIRQNKKNIIIEVKVESGLRAYRLKKRNISQIKMYKNITDMKVNGVYLLSKYAVFDDALESGGNVLWSQIHSILVKSKNEITANFVSFLEENGMETTMINPGAENTVGSIAAIMSLIENAWRGENRDKKYPLKEDITRAWIGFRIDKDAAWIGQLLEMKDYLVFQPLSNKLIKRAEKIYKEKNESVKMDEDNNGNYVFAKIKISGIASLKTQGEQQERLQEWIKEEIAQIL